MQMIYNILAVLLVILAIPVFIVRAIREKGFVERLKQSFGFLPLEAIEPVANKDCIWVHAASVGEIVAASPLIKEFRNEFPSNPILISVVTSSGYEMAKRIVKDADSIIYFPLDLPYLSSKVMGTIMPMVFLPVETELWPNFLKAARKYKIPVMMVNGRISDKSVKRYHHLRGVLKDMIATVNKFCMQSRIDAEYIIKLGAPPSLVTVTGNTKFDQTYTDVTPNEKQELLRQMGFNGAEQIFLAGSTHKGEEEIVLKAFTKVKEQFPHSKLLIAPRDIMRTDEIISLALNYNIKGKKRTQLKLEPTADHDLVVLDTIGELGKVYSIGDIIYVGGSLVAHGGHNILEPAAHGKPIIVGPNMFNFKETHALFSGRKACITVKTVEQLTQTVLNLLHDEDLRNNMQNETLQIVRENQGAARRSALYLREMLEQCQANRTKKQVRVQLVENFQMSLYKMVHGEEKGIISKFFLLVLYLFSYIYRHLLKLKLFLYKTNIIKQHKLDCHVISLGNITVGGTGKTPTAQILAKAISNMGYKVAILNRGYRAKWKGKVGVVSDGKKIYMTAVEAGDEAFLLAKRLPKVPVIIGADRAITGKYAVKKLGAEVVILDDGYQHWQLQRDIDILLIDAINVFGNNYILPRGTLREPLEHLDRADVCLLTKVDQSSSDIIDNIKHTINKHNKKALIIESSHSPKCFIEITNWYKNISNSNLPLNSMANKKITAVSAIGNPASFEKTLEDISAQLAYSIRFPDHHEYTMAEMQSVMDQAVEHNSEAIVITDKDAVKIPAEFIHSERALPVYVLSIEVEFLNNYHELMGLIKNRLKKTKSIRR